MLSVNFSPFPVLETPRLLLRQLSKEDTIAFYELRNDPQVLAYLDRHPDTSIEMTELKVQEILDNEKKNEGIMWVICMKDKPNEMIGTIGYWQLIKQHFRAETGYLLSPRFWRRGIMKEAMHVVMEYGFTIMNLHSIEANINCDNIASAVLLESSGFIKEAHFKENYYYNGKFYDSIIYSKLNNYPQ